ncbi:MAG: hypothetical protein JRN17_03055 [Nitrososphaerota archaeon]|nr:hypothetical protein [Nitrososphaerota archaeon]
MGTTCMVCGGRGKFSFVITEWSAPDATAQGYAITTSSIEVPCKCCNGRGGNRAH